MKKISNRLVFKHAGVHESQIEQLMSLMALSGITKPAFINSIIDWLVYGHDIKATADKFEINYRTIERQIVRLEKLYPIAEDIYKHDSFSASIIDRGALDSEELLRKLLELSRFDQDVTLGKLKCYLIDGMSQLDASKKFGADNNVILVRQLKKLRSKVELIDKIFADA